MKTFVCPECGSECVGTIENMTGLSYVVMRDDGTLEYEGYTEIYYDDSTTQIGPNGKRVFGCKNCNHEWTSDVKFEWEKNDESTDAAH